MRFSHVSLTLHARNSSVIRRIAPLRPGRRTIAALSAGVVVAAGAVVTALPASADPGPVAQRSATTGVTSDALPTAQINGVVWQQAITGNTVWAGGSFSSARPAGSAAGSNESAHANLVAYTLSTGVMTSWNPGTNGEVKAVAATPDGSRIYVGGSFTTVGGVTHNRVAAFNTSDGSLISSFTPSVDAKVNAIVATNTAVYIGGAFTTISGVARNKVAALSPTGGVLAFNANADATLNALTITPDGSKVILGGTFQNVGGQSEYGLAAVNSTTGAVVPWAANQSVQNAGTQAAITSLTTDGNAVYGTGYVFGQGGNLEGAFSADPSSGNINWIEDCHGDTYGAYSSGSAVYTVSHAHYCGNVGGFPQTSPTWTFHRAMAFSANATGTINHDIYGYHDWYGYPSPSVINWFPDLTTGSYTGQSQAAWTVTGNGKYVVLGGEFPSVNGTAQQGLVRFAVPSISPHADGPRVSGSNFKPTLVSLARGTVRVSWQSDWDRDDQVLTYKVYRNGNTTTPVYTVTGTSQFWNRPYLGFTDKGLTPGSTYSYRISASDPDGNTVKGDGVSITVPTSTPTTSTYANDVAADGASHYWRLGESSGSTAYDYANYDDLTEGTGVGSTSPRPVSGAVNGDGDGATTFDGTTNGVAYDPAPVVGPNTFTEEAWINTTTTSGGKIIGFGDSTNGTSNNYDRHLYMDNAGRLYFGICCSTGVKTINTAKAYNDGQWHYVVGTLSSAGMVFYVDGRKIGADPATTTAQPYTGYWRVGGDNLNAWTNQPSSNDFAGSIDEAAVYPTALSLAQVQQHYTDSGRTVGTPAPTDSYAKVVLADKPDIYWRLNDTSNASALDSSGNSEDGVYSGGETFGTTSPVATVGTAVTFNGQDGTIGSTDALTSPSVYTEEAWFNTTTTHGGKIVGFGGNQSGNSGSYDRHVYMENNGQLEFGTYTGQLNLATSPKSYNDGQWHHMVATQGPDGMTLYVDGAAVATNSQTGALPYTGYWRVGGDSDWGGDSPYFAGSIDEVAIYNSVELTAAQVRTHYRASAASSNAAPVASFTSKCNGPACAFDASGSSDPDGSVASYAWDFGDGSTGTGAKPSHTYANGGTYTVTLSVKDDQGASSTAVRSVKVVPAPADKYGKTVFADSPAIFWRLNETGGPTAVDASANGENGVYAGGVSYGTTSPVGTTGTAVTFNGSDGTIGSVDTFDNPTVYSEEAWFNTTTTHGGKIVGFGNNQSGYSNSYDRHVYMENSGQLDFGTYTGQLNIAQSPNSYNDGKWHHMVATQGPDGMTLYVDGVAVATNPQTQAQPYTGYWRVGGDSDWGGDSAFLAGSIDEVAIYNSELTAGQVAAHYQAGGVSTAPANQAPSAAFTPSCTYLDCTFDGSASSDADGTVSSYAWDFGDGTSGTGVNPAHSYAKAGTYTVSLVVTDNQGAKSTAATQSLTVSTKPNKAPTAVLATPSCTYLACTFDGSGSSDSDGTVSSYDWDFGDGTTGTGVNPAHTYAKAGTYSVSLVVTDNGGAQSTAATKSVTVTANQAPTAAFTSSCTNLGCSFDGSTSSDSDGTVAGYAWDFGDGTSGTGAKPTHTYARAGSYTVSLVVTDDQGASSAAKTATLSVSAANQPPTAAFTNSCTDLSCTFDASTSSDSDGTVAGYAWDFGDGTSGTGAKPAHTYTKAGSYTVSLVVTDDKGATSTAKTASVTVTAPANKPPVASFTASASGLVASFDGRASSDPDGTITNYAWNFGDGTTGTGVNPQHTYAAGGTYTVSLTVTDNASATNTTSQSLTVTAPAATVVAKDAFGRTVATGFGTADTGGAWTTSGSNSTFSVGGGVAKMAATATSAAPLAVLANAKAANVDYALDFSVDKTPTGGGSYIAALARRNGTSDYRLQVVVKPNATTLSVIKVINNVETTIATSTISNATYVAGTVWHLRFDVSGSGTTKLTGKIWKDGTTEPTAWQVSTTDTEATLQGSGAVGLRSYLSGTSTSAPVTTSFDNLAVTVLQ